MKVLLLLSIRLFGGRFSSLESVQKLRARVWVQLNWFVCVKIIYRWEVHVKVGG